MKDDKKKSKHLAMVLMYYGYSIEGVTFKIVCPFHKDVNPSLTVNIEKGVWFCFGCSSSGDAFDFVKMMESKYNNLNELQSLVLFYKIIRNKKIKSKIKKEVNFKKLNPESGNALQEAMDYYYCLPKTDWTDYKLDNDQVETRMYMTKRGFEPEILNDIGCRYNFNKNYKLIFPMLDNEVFKGWVCRTTDKEIENGGRKYLYNKGFSRATTLVGNYGKKDYVFIVEGFMDRLKLYQFGIKNSVAILGWKLSANQIQKLKDSGIKRVICCLDNDNKGKKGYKYCKQFFKTYRFQFLKGVKDIGEMNKSSFKKMFRRTKEKYNFKLKGEK